MRTLIHLSDLHFGRIDPGILDPLRHAVHDAKPHLVAISGDFTQRARRSQFAAARAFMDTLEPPKLVVPGNHDVPYWNVARRFLQPLTRYRRYISEELEPEYQDEEMIVLGVNTARAFAHGGGLINARQVDRIVRRLAGLPQALVRIIVTHHPFDLPPGYASGACSAGTHGDDPAVGGECRPVPLRPSASQSCLTGGRADRIEGHSGLIVQAGTVSSRSRGELPSFNLLRIERPEIALVKYVWNPAAGRFAPLDWARYRHSAEGWISA